MTTYIDAPLLLGSELGNDDLWAKLYHLLLPKVKGWIYNSGVHAWRGQEYDVAWDIVLTAIEHTLAYIKRAQQQGIAVHSPEHLSIVIAKNHYRDCRLLVSKQETLEFYGSALFRRFVEAQSQGDTAIQLEDIKEALKTLSDLSLLAFARFKEIGNDVKTLSQWEKRQTQLPGSHLRRRIAKLSGEEWVTLPYHSYLVGWGSIKHSARRGRHHEILFHISSNLQHCFIRSIERAIKTNCKPVLYALQAGSGVIDLPRDVSVRARPDQRCPYCWKTDKEFLQRTSYHFTTPLQHRFRPFIVAIDILYRSPGFPYTAKARKGDRSDNWRTKETTWQRSSGRTSVGQSSSEYTIKTSQRPLGVHLNIQQILDRDDHRQERYLRE